MSLLSLTLNTYEAERDSSTTAKNVETPPWMTATPISDTACDTSREGQDDNRDVNIRHGIRNTSKRTI